MNNSRARVYAYIKQDRFILESAEVSGNWSGSTDITDITASVNHREGTNSISFDKDGTTQTYGQITRTFAAGETINLTDYLDGILGYWVNLSSLTNIANVQLIIGESASHNYIYQTADTALTTGWNKIEVDINTPTSTTGDGAAWSSINYIALKVNFDAAGNTLTAILFDTAYVKYSITNKTEIISSEDSGLASDTGEDSSNDVIKNIKNYFANSTYTWLIDQSAALEASTIVKGSIGTLLSVDGRIDSTAPSNTYYIQFLNAASVPANGAVTHLKTPLKIQHVTGTDSHVSIDFTNVNGLHGSTGLVIVLSTTEFTKTLAGAYLSLTNWYV